ncbi:SEC-C metal-binding domain-containing protein [Accumulibacter sp.]|uniref:SEC-C metal-binding domain-containing protein n=1 Tax=Accumulibacter sp. TaxID=2053492 RepID=UPI0025EBACCD|nr:SEC-C metal-binding domain-containing protein [Accumulibacter sp.]MCM8627736.1 SEC-C metal-binding domain-containing protein [Accumulibacter sp.]
MLAQWDALDASRRIDGAAVLATTGGPAVAEFALARADELLRDDLERWCSLALAEPDPRLLERLRPEMRRRQPLLDETFYCLCLVLSVEPTELEEVRSRVIKERQRRIARTELLASDTPLRNPERLYLPLRCRPCAAVNRYDVRAVTVGGLTTDDMLIADEPSCPSCGKSGNLDFEPQARMTVAAQMLAQRASGDWQRAGTAQVIIAERVRQPDGKVQTIPPYYASLEQKVARNIQDWRSWLRLGKLQYHIYRPAAALTSLRKAYAINPLCLEVVVGFAQELSEAGHQTEAFDVLDGPQAHSRRWHTLSGNMAEARGEFIGLPDSLSRQLGVAQASSQTAAAHADLTKVGRNDLCPCGSGRKFKKCCMS